MRIFRLQEPKPHAKTVVVDDALCMTGSFDVSTFERRRTAELAVLAWDAALGTAIRNCFQRCMPRSEQVLLAEWRRRSVLRRALDRVS